MAKKSNFLERLKRGDVLLADGAWGTEVQKLGLESGGCSEEWNLSHPDRIQQIARNYLKAGAEMVLTNTFGGNRFGLMRHGLGEKVAEINRAGARLSREAADECGGFVAASVGPTGEFVEPLGLLSETEMYNAFREQIQALKEGGADAVLVETVYALDEIRLAIKAAKDVGLLCMSTMTFDPGAFGFKTMMGVTVEQATKAMDEYGADVIGSNCGNGIENMVQIMREMRPLTKKPLLVQSNAGMPKLVKGRIEYHETPEWMAGKMKDMVEAGANIIGGCCGTTPEHIQRFREAIDRLKK